MKSLRKWVTPLPKKPENPDRMDSCDSCGREIHVGMGEVCCPFCMYEINNEDDGEDADV